jgi:hypothetical protein
VKVVRKLFLKRATLNKRKAASKVATLNKESPKTKFTEDDFIALEKGIFPRKDKVIDYIYDDPK